MQHLYLILEDVVDPELLSKCLLENAVPEIDHLTIGKCFLQFDNNKLILHLNIFEL